MSFSDPSLEVIERLSNEITEILMSTQEVLVNELYQIGQTIDPSQLANLNSKEILRVKTQNAISKFDIGHTQLLSSMNAFGAINETSLQALKDLSLKQFMSTIDNMGDIIFNEVTKGLFSGLSRDAIFDSVKGLSGFKDYQLESMINTQFSNYSRAVTNNMVDGLPKDSILRYVGAMDERTRDICREMYMSGGMTKDEVQKSFGKYGDIMSNGGGYNCRHRWTYVSEKYQANSAGFRTVKDAKKAIKEGNFKELQSRFEES